MSRKKEKVIGIHEYIEQQLRTQREIKPLLNQPSGGGVEKLKAEIRRVNVLLRENHNPHTYHQNKKYLKRLNKELRKYANKS